MQRKKLPRLNKKQKDEFKLKFVEQFHKNMGLMNFTCNQLGVTRATICNWKKDDPVFAELLDDAKEFSKDFAESKLFNAIRESNLTAVMYFLNNRARDRGYGAQSQTEVKVDSRTMQTTITVIDTETQNELKKLMYENDKSIRGKSESI
jgi:hypothetical protein